MVWCRWKSSATKSEGTSDKTRLRTAGLIFDYTLTIKNNYVKLKQWKLILVLQSSIRLLELLPGLQGLERGQKNNANMYEPMWELSIQKK